MICSRCFPGDSHLACDSRTVAANPHPESSELEQVGDALEAFRTILVPLNGTRNAELILPYVELLAHRSGGEIVLLRVTSPAVRVMTTGLPVPGEIDVGPTESDQRLEVAAYLDAVKRRLAGRGLRVTTVAALGIPEEVISQRARSFGADLIAMTTHARGGLRRVVYGSVADAVVQHATCPVCLLPVREGERNTAIRTWAR